MKKSPEKQKFHFEHYQENQNEKNRKLNKKTQAFIIFAINTNFRNLFKQQQQQTRKT